MIAEDFIMLGQLQTKYRPNYFKSIFNLIIGLGLLSGGLWGVLSTLNTTSERMFTPLLAILALAGAWLVFASARLLMKYVAVYENGLQIRNGFAQPKTVYYKDIHAVVPLSGRYTRRAGTHSPVKFSLGYGLDTKAGRVFINSDFLRSDELGGQIEQKVAEARVPQIVREIQHGKPYSYSVKTGYYLNPQDAQLTLTDEGLRVNGSLPIAWKDLNVTPQVDEWNTLIARIRTNAEPITFIMENYPAFAYHVIKGYLSELKNVQQSYSQNGHRA
jgi:hypothetical protein